jgi:hypothetical protein
MLSLNSLLEPGGFAAISRGFRRQPTPPVSIGQEPMIPEGSQQRGCDPFGIVSIVDDQNLQCRCAQLQANGFDPSGIDFISSPAAEP